MQIDTRSSISIVPRDKFITDPFFLAARQTLEKNLLELSQNNSREAELLPLSCSVAGLPPWYCCCANQAIERLGDWAPAVLIPCFNCCPAKAAEAQVASSSCEVYTVQDPVYSTPPGQVFFTTDNCQLVIDVHNFHPNEINVCVKDFYIEVSAQHQEELSQQHTQLAIQKIYKMPYPLNTDMVQCSLSKDGILFLIAPWLRAP